MKELEKVNQDNIEIGAEQNKESKKVFINSIIPHENHTCFQYNTKTNALSKAEFKKQDVKIWDSKDGIQHGAVKKEIIVDSDCIYVSCLNEENAVKHFSKILGYRCVPVEITEIKK